MPPSDPYLLAAEHLTDSYSVLIVGAASRSWYEDRNLLVDLLFLCSQAEVIAAAGHGAFKFALQEVAENCGREVLFDEVDLSYFSLCIALPARNSEEMLSAGQTLVEALDHKIPALVIWPDRDASYVTTLEEARKPWKKKKGRT